MPNWKAFETLFVDKFSSIVLERWETGTGLLCTEALESVLDGYN